MSSSVQNVIFDLGGVLLNWDVDAIIAAVFDSPEARDTVKRVVFDHPDWLAMDQGTLPEDEAVQRFARRADQPVDSMERLMDQVRASLTPKPDSLALLEELDGRGVPLYCLSNMHELNIAYLRERYDFFSRFRGIVISAHVEIIKPDAGIFEHLLSTCDLDPAQSVFVDDHPANVEGARAVGLQAVLFTDAASCRRQLDALLG